MKSDYNVPLPSRAQLAYHEEELAAFIHFGMNTFYETEWGDGTEDPAVFNPTKLDAEQWIKTLKEAGFKRVILVVKHHDGFVLYPSKYTDYTIAKSPWKDGQGDLLLEVSKAVTKYDMGLGIYLSPWDRHDERYSIERQDEYNEYYLNQLKEILENPLYGNNGKFVEIWMDGARGEDEQKVSYSFDKWFKYIQSQLGEDVSIFSEEPTSVRWIGNESGKAGDPLWQRISIEKMSKLKNEDFFYLNHGDKYGDLYSVGEADVSIRSGWFYREGQNLKTLDELMEIYFYSVGRGAPLLLNVPPTKEGTFAKEDEKLLKDFRKELNRIQSTKMTGIKSIETLSGGKEVMINFVEPTTFDLIELKEDIEKGQRIASFEVLILENDEWKKLTQGNTIGAKRLLQTDKVKAEKIKINILETMGKTEIKSIQFYHTGLSVGQNKDSTEEQKNLNVSFSKEKIVVKRGETAHIQLAGKGKGEKKIKISTYPHTAVHGRHYLDLNHTFLMEEDGAQTISIETLFYQEPENSISFYVKAEPGNEQTYIGAIDTVEVIIQ